MITLRGQSWPVIRKFDCHVFDVGYPEGGGLFTVFPISPKDYREKNPTRAKVNVRQGKKSVFFDITDDWGYTQTVEISNDETEAIDAAISAARDQGLCA